MKRIGVIAFTRKGCELAKRLSDGLASVLADAVVTVSGPARFADELGVSAYDHLGSWTAGHFEADYALVFVGATGIAVRAIAPHVHDKMSDPAVVCVDEAGRVAVSLLSGHVGGGNDVARAVAEVLGGDAAVSTATDLNGVFAIDEFARDNSLAIAERVYAKEISAALLEGTAVSFGKAPGELGAVVSSDLSAQPFEKTLHLVPRDAVVGVGCRRGTPAEAIEAAVDAALLQAGTAPEAVRVLATIDVKADEPGMREAAERNGWEFSVFSADELAQVEGEFASSDFVRETVGVDNVCERAVVAAGGTLVLGKQANDGVTVAVGRVDVRPSQREQAVLHVVGLGPGGASDMTGRARAAIEASDLIVGYTVYVDLLRDEFPDKEILTTPMRKEVERCRMALEAAAGGRAVAMVCSGDPGVYGMAGLIFELAGESPDFARVDIRIVPGVSAANGGAAVLGAPLMHDYCVISLSDLLTPWDTIARRLAAAAKADFAIALYNPSSHKRPDYLRRACDILLAHKSGDTVCGTVRNIGREGEEAHVMTLRELRDTQVDMFTCVFVGNSHTRVIDGKMVTPRGYKLEEAPSEAGVIPRILVFGGTTEGRELVEWLDARGTCQVTACSATEYGGSLLPVSERVTSIADRLDAAAMQKLMQEGAFTCVVDATHPHAAQVSANIAAAAERAGVPLLRLAREGESRQTADYAACDLPEAVRKAAACAGNVLLTTGAKDVEAFTSAMSDFTDRLYVRILPVADSIDCVRALGMPVSHIIAMQGPFGQDMNEAVIRSYDIKMLVTKESGATGGFREKLDAARACGIEAVVIGRPAGADGITGQEVRRELETRYGV